MPMGLHWEHRGVLREASGTVLAQEFLDSVAMLQNDDRFDRLQYIIEDFSAVTDAHFTESDVDMVIAMTIGAAFTNPHIRIAVVADQPQVLGLVAVFSRTSPYEMRVFGSVPAARAWVAENAVSTTPLELQLAAAVAEPIDTLRY